METRDKVFSIVYLGMIESFNTLSNLLGCGGTDEQIHNEGIKFAAFIKAYGRLIPKRGKNGIYCLE